MEILIVAIVMLFIMEYTKKINSNKFFNDTKKHLNILKEDDYEFLLRAKYGEKADPDYAFSKRIRNGILVTLVLIFVFLSKLNFINVLAAFIVGYLVFKSEYRELKRYYKVHLHDINLMPFYNCYNGEYVTDIFINTSTTTTKAVDDSGNETEVTTINHNIIQSDPNVRGKKVISIPVKFGETYSIFIDCSTQVEIMCGFYGNKGYISPTQTPAVEIKTENKYASLRYTSFRDGFTYTTPKPEKSTYPYTRFFRMFIQLPLNTDSSIVVLEGDYTIKNTAYGTYTYNEEEKQLAIDISDFPTKVKQNQTLLSDLSLTQIAGTVSYAFSDRLIEYLTCNVITSEETIIQNILRVQQYASSLINAKLNHTEPFNMSLSTPDVWDTKLQTYLFNLAKESKYIQNKLF